jgi:hypothetical protein
MPPSVSLSLSLSHKHKHKRASNGKVWQEILRNPSLAADAQQKLYVTLSNNLGEKVQVSSLFLRKEVISSILVVWRQITSHTGELPTVLNLVNVNF